MIWKMKYAVIYFGFDKVKDCFLSNSFYLYLSVSICICVKEIP